MNKSILWLIGLLFVTSLSIVSCSETDGTEDPYANWEERNQRYIDSIATVAEANRGNGEGQWKIIRSYKLPSLGLNETGKPYQSERYRKESSYDRSSVHSGN
jgi:FKBP-type peptidyl-prolyl cis-trans isomerase FklB